MFTIALQCRLRFILISQRGSLAQPVSGRAGTRAARRSCGLRTQVRSCCLSHATAPPAPDTGLVCSSYSVDSRPVHDQMYHIQPGFALSGSVSPNKMFVP